LHHCDRRSQANPARPGTGQHEEHRRLKKFRFVDLLEGKAARLVAILIFVAIVLLLALIMTQTA
jgi:hypothetical protein